MIRGMRAWLVLIVVAVHGCVRATSSQPTSEADSSETPAPPTSPRTIVARGFGAEVRLIEGPGFLVDGNAPPPPPGSTPTRYEALHGSCIGEPAGCSQAGGIVRSSASFELACARLVEAGFAVESR